MLDPGSQVTLICQQIFEQEILPHIQQSDREKAEAHQLFHLTAANHGKLPVSMNVELDLDFLGIFVAKQLGFLLPKSPMNFWIHAIKPNMPCVIGWNLIKLAYEVFVQKYGELSLENFDCPTGVQSAIIFTASCFPSLQGRWISIGQCFP